VKNVYKMNEKFVIKIQSNDDPNNRHKLLVYNKNKKYAVFIDQNKHRNESRRLLQLMRRHGVGGPYNKNIYKAYFYAWVDKHRKLHVLIEDVLALQPW